MIPDLSHADWIAPHQLRISTLCTHGSVSSGGTFGVDAARVGVAGVIHALDPGGDVAASKTVLVERTTGAPSKKKRIGELWIGQTSRKFVSVPWGTPGPAEQVVGGGRSPSEVGAASRSDGAAVNGIPARGVVPAGLAAAHCHASSAHLDIRGEKNPSSIRIF